MERRYDGAIRTFLANRHFYVYAVDGDEIIVQRGGMTDDGQPHPRWRACLNGDVVGEEETRRECYEAARQVSGKVRTQRLKAEITAEMEQCLTTEWMGMDVPTEVDDFFGGLTIADWPGPRTTTELLAERTNADVAPPTPHVDQWNVDQ
jgi:hypothetical protein